jgi:DGQHR domain-containing protein
MRGAFNLPLDQVFPVFRFVQSRKEIFVGVLSAKQLLDDRLDVRAWFGGRGYQRMRNSEKVDAIADFISKTKGIMPPSVLVGIRDPAVRYEGDSKAGLLKVPTNARLYVVDGQHRIWGYRRSDERGDDVGEFSLPVVFLCPTIWSRELLPDVEEGKQFITINKTQSKVKKELVDAFVYSLASPDTIEPRYNLDGVSADIRKEMRRRIRARSVAVDLCAWPAWRGKVREPNSVRRESIIGITSLVDTLASDVVEHPSYQARLPGDIAKDLEHYWEAILECYPHAKTDPRHYWVQKLLGIAVFHKLFPYIDAAAKDKSAVGYEDVIRNKAKLLPEESFWGKSGKARESGSSYLTREQIARRIWPRMRGSKKR